MTTSRGSITRAEIFQQPELWPTTVERVQANARRASYASSAPLITGAGSSAYAATAVAAAWPGARAIPTTELLVDRRELAVGFDRNGLLISIARSGDSPESLGVIEQVRRLRPASRHLAITCNPDGRLARAEGVDAILLDPRTNDRSLAVTSSFSNTVLAGLCLREVDQIAGAMAEICHRAEAALPRLDQAAEAIARTPVTRVAVLAPPALFGAAREAALKILEMSDGEVMSMPETVLGLRHGPMTFLREDALVVLFGSTDPIHRRYEEDLLRELRAKKLGRAVVIAPASVPASLVDELVPANAPELPDMLRTPFEIVFAQLLALRIGLTRGVDPDAPSPRGVINRVVQGVRVHED